jgi:hypothetical protein
MKFLHESQARLGQPRRRKLAAQRASNRSAHPISLVIPKTRKWRRIVLWLVLFKIGYLALVCAACRMWPNLNLDKFYEINTVWFNSVDPVWAQQRNPSFTSHFTTWDAEHYLFLSERGYQKDAPSSAFYPLWPVAVRWASILTGGSHIIAGMVLANVFSLAAWVFFYIAASKRFGESVALWALVFLIVFPGSLFYQFIYSESLFFLLVMLLWFGLERKHYGLAWFAAFLLPLCRAVGVFSLLPTTWHWLMQRDWTLLAHWRWMCENRQPEKPREELKSLHVGWKGYAMISAAPLGLILYFALMRAWTGNPFEGIDAQKYWGVHSLSNLWNLPKFIIGFVEPTAWHGFSGSVLDRCAFVLLAYSLRLIWRLGNDMVVWTYVLGILPAMSGTFVSFIRFESTVFPLFIALAVFFTSLKMRWPLITCIVLSGLMHVVLLWRFVNFRWAG